MLARYHIHYPCTDEARKRAVWSVRHTTMLPITILLVDDQPLFREGLRMVLSTQSDLKVVGEAANGMEALELAAQLQPQLVLMDLRMPCWTALPQRASSTLCCLSAACWL